MQEFFTCYSASSSWNGAWHTIGTQTYLLDGWQASVPGGQGDQHPWRGAGMETESLRLESFAHAPLCLKGVGAELQRKREKNSLQRGSTPSWASVLQKRAGQATVFTAPSCFSGDISLTTATTNRRVLAPACCLPGPPLSLPHSLTHSTQELDEPE